MSIGELEEARELGTSSSTSRTLWSVFDHSLQPLLHNAWQGCCGFLQGLRPRLLGPCSTVPIMEHRDPATPGWDGNVVDGVAGAISSGASARPSRTSSNDGERCGAGEATRGPNPSPFSPRLDFHIDLVSSSEVALRIDFTSVQLEPARLGPMAAVEAGAAAVEVAVEARLEVEVGAKEEGNRSEVDEGSEEEGERTPRQFARRLKCRAGRSLRDLILGAQHASHMPCHCSTHLLAYHHLPTTLYPSLLCPSGTGAWWRWSSGDAEQDLPEVDNDLTEPSSALASAPAQVRRENPDEGDMCARSGAASGCWQGWLGGCGVAFL